MGDNNKDSNDKDSNSNDKQTSPTLTSTPAPRTKTKNYNPNKAGKTKVRFDGADVTAMVAHLQRTVLGQRVLNIYDDVNSNNNSTYIIKLENKEFILLESGVRFHTSIRQQRQNNSSAAAAATSNMPSPFCAKLRKHLRGLRLEQVIQLGQGDRVVLLQFGVAQQKFALILELYSKGNLILVDGNTYTIQALLRSHTYETNKHNSTDDNNTEAEGKQVVHVQVGHVYPVTYATNWKTNDSNKEDDGDKTTLSTVVDNAAATQLPTENAASPGYILYRPRPDAEQQQEKTSPDESETTTNAKATTLTAVTTSLDLPHADKILEEFTPRLLEQHQGCLYITYDNFADAVDDFFAHLLLQKQWIRAIAAETAARQKVEKVRQNQLDRLVASEQEQEGMSKQAQAIQLNADNVEKALAVINSALDSGMDWNQLEEVVAVEQQQQNPIAILIQKLELEQDAMILNLSTALFDNNAPTLNVRVSLKESAHTNANNLFAKYRASKEKTQKTIEGNRKALQAAEETALRQLAEAQKRTKHSTNLVYKRKPAWFEKFHWFITSENYLVLGGRDAHQNEILVKRYLRSGDAYLHADVHGAASCILRAKRRRKSTGQNNNNKTSTSTEPVPLSERALQEAGNFCVCRSSAWTKKMVLSAWWVEHHQVSKTAPTGEYLTVGSFMIRGKKNFLPPCQLEMGMAVLFRLGDDDLDGIARHQNERRDFALMELEEASAMDDDDDEEEEAREVGTGGVSSSTAGGVSSSNVLALQTEHPQEIDAQVRDQPEQQGQHNYKDDQEELQPNSSIENQLAESEQNDGTPDHSLNTNNATKPKRGLSVADRKLIKKYGSLEEAKRVLAARDEGSKDTAADVLSSLLPSTTSENTDGQGAAKRGKKAKMNRMMKKYRDQDEEDRELAMLALQGGEKEKKKKHSKSNKKHNKIAYSQAQEKMAADTVALLVKDAAKVAEQLTDETRSVLAQCVTVAADSGGGDDQNTTTVRWDKFDATTLDQLIALSPEAQLAAAKRLLHLKQTTRVDNFSGCLGGIIRTINKYGHEKLLAEAESSEGAKRKTKAEKEAEAQKWKQTMAEEGVVELDTEEDAMDDTVELSKLTGKPHPDDLILNAVAVCAPYQTLAQYAYRIKLTPGSMKRGKAAKQCIEMFLHDDSNKSQVNHTRCKDLIKRVPDNDWLQAICPDVKISAAGAAKKGKTARKKGKIKR